MNRGDARRVEVAPGRLDGWVERFAASHGEVAWSLDRGTSPSSWVGRATDGSWARLQGWGEATATCGDDRPDRPSPDRPPPDRSSPDRPSPDPAGAWAAPPGPLLVLLIRRGGYAVAVASPAGELVRHKVGTRHVQSRTAAGGWSQQRFARRRGNQADALVEAVVGHARQLVEGEPGGAEVRGGGGAPVLTARQGVEALVLGGDRTLAAEVLEELATGPLTTLDGLPRRELWDLPDPRRAVLDEALRRAVAVRVEVHNA